MQRSKRAYEQVAEGFIGLAIWGAIFNWLGLPSRGWIIVSAAIGIAVIIIGVITEEGL